jgi:hypothetical protein
MDPFNRGVVAVTPAGCPAAVAVDADDLVQVGRELRRPGKPCREGVRVATDEFQELISNRAGPTHRIDVHQEAQLVA